MYIIIYVTVSKPQEAKKIASSLINKKLAACVNIVDRVESLFWWKGKVDSGKEVLMIIKSKKIKLAAIIKEVRSLHSYEVPEIIALPIIAGDKDYLRWIDASLR